MAFVPVYILILLLTITVDYWAAIKIENSSGRLRKFYLQISIVSTCLILFFFKYFNFFNQNFEALAKLFDLRYPIPALNIILPIGLSFHTFQSLSYVIEVYRGNQKAERHFGIYSLYVMFYPQLVAGPIERPQNLLHQFHEKHYFNYDRVRSGLMVILWGLFKKMVIADTLAKYVNIVYNNPGHYHGWPVLLATYFFAFQIYCDFSGYSNIAIGTARVMGFELMTNFNKPYFSRNVSEFWRRWHISLSTWFKDYIYIPLGGSRVVKWRWYYNLFITFLISGLWHGANWTFVIWGSLLGVCLIFESATSHIRKKLYLWSGLHARPRLEHFISAFITFQVICLGWIFFRAANLHAAVTILKSIFHSAPISSVKVDSFFAIDLILCCLYVIFLLFTEYITDNVSPEIYVISRRRPYRWACYVSLLLAIAVLGNFGYAQFIYFQF
jgi:D-alanyl-lipoteichoic acid acyltransferase DltB (MBOAT superfamily)